VLSKERRTKQTEKEAMDGPPVNDFCSICHGHFNIACQANCSHWFCGQFLLHFSSTLPFSFRISLKTRIQCEFFFRSFFKKEEDFDGIHE
jgi:hypothetical protein